MHLSISKNVPRDATWQSLPEPEACIDMPECNVVQDCVMGAWNQWCATALLRETSVCVSESSFAAQIFLTGRTAVAAASAFGKEIESLNDLPPRAESLRPRFK